VPGTGGMRASAKLFATRWILSITGPGPSSASQDRLGFNRTGWRSSNTSSTGDQLTMPERYDSCSYLNTLKLPAARSAALPYPTQAVVSSSTWSSSPSGPGQRRQPDSQPCDSSTARRQSAAAATRQPYVASISPASVTHLGGTSVSISGWGYSAATAASFGGVNATAFTDGQRQHHRLYYPSRVDRGGERDGSQPSGIWDTGGGLQLHLSYQAEYDQRRQPDSCPRRI
jgi:hypothetical protein